MNDDPILEALRRRPSDERDFDVPLRLPGRPDEFAEPLTGLVPSMGLRRSDGSRPQVRSRTPVRALPALVLVVVLALVAFASLRPNPNTDSGPAASPTGQDVAVPTYQLTGRVACFGQGPGLIPVPGGPLDACPNMAVPPDGYGAATWTLDPAYPYSPDSTELHVLAQEWECASGQSAAGRVVQNVAFESDRVVVTLAVRQPVGDFQTCQGNPPTPVVLFLDQPVGDRTLYDGGLYPAVAQAAAGEAIVTPSPTPYPSAWHQPMDCSSDVDVAGFFKAAAMDLPFDIYCPVLPEGWTVKRPADGGVGTEKDGWISIGYQGPNGQTFGIQEGAFCEAVGAICDRIAAAPDTVPFGDVDAHLGNSGDMWFAYTTPSGGAMYSAWGQGMTRDAFLSVLASLIIVGK
jgi:hypothetical protein